MYTSLILTLRDAEISQILKRSENGHLSNADNSLIRRTLSLTLSCYEHLSIFEHGHLSNTDTSLIRTCLQHFSSRDTLFMLILI